MAVVFSLECCELGLPAETEKFRCIPMTYEEVSNFVQEETDKEKFLEQFYQNCHFSSFSCDIQNFFQFSRYFVINFYRTDIKNSFMDFEGTLMGVSKLFRNCLQNYLLKINSIKIRLRRYSNISILYLLPNQILYYVCLLCVSIEKK